MSQAGDVRIWRLSSGGRVVECVMVSCCNGAELQLVTDSEITLRELYPTKSDLYERARLLEAEYRAALASDGS